MIEKSLSERRKVSIEHAVLRDIGIKKRLDELQPEQRRDLQRFCETWTNIISDLHSLRGGIGMKKRIENMHSQQPSRSRE